MNFWRVYGGSPPPPPCHPQATPWSTVGFAGALLMYNTYLLMYNTYLALQRNKMGFGMSHRQYIDSSLMPWASSQHVVVHAYSVIHSMYLLCM